MKILISTFVAMMVTGLAWGEDAMTVEQFKKIVATSGDSTPLRAELAPLPFWRDAMCSVTIKHQDGKVFKEDCAQTAKTVSGKYIVFTVESKFYKQPISAIVGYDDSALAIRTWGLFGDTLSQSTIVFDPEKKISASTSTYSNDIMEISVESYTEKETSERTLVYKNGVLSMTREVKTFPSGKTEKVEQAAPSDGGKPSN